MGAEIDVVPGTEISFLRRVAIAWVLFSAKTKTFEVHKFIPGRTYSLERRS